MKTDLYIIYIIVNNKIGSAKRVFVMNVLMQVGRRV